MKRRPLRRCRWRVFQPKTRQGGFCVATPTSNYAYDPQGRMVWKVVSRGGAEAQSWEDEKATSYLWDAYNIIAETVSSDSATTTTYNVWGLDVDGTLQGAGGVGGLLAVVSPLPLGDGQGEGGTVYLPCYDANGNIMEYVSEDGTIAAHREYDPFGGTVVATGNADAFTHWFSTKPWCAATGLSEYQYRKYSQVMGRWLNRDPIFEIGSLNIYGFLQNAPSRWVDLLGLRKMLAHVVGQGGRLLGYSPNLSAAAKKLNLKFIKKFDPKLDAMKKECKTCGVSDIYIYIKGMRE